MSVMFLVNAAKKNRAPEERKFLIGTPRWGSSTKAPATITLSALAAQVFHRLAFSARTCGTPHSSICRKQYPPPQACSRQVTPISRSSGAGQVQPQASPATVFYRRIFVERAPSLSRRDASRTNRPTTSPSSNCVLRAAFSLSDRRRYCDACIGGPKAQTHTSPGQSEERAPAWVTQLSRQSPEGGDTTAPQSDVSSGNSSSLRPSVRRISGLPRPFAICGNPQSAVPKPHR